MQLLTPGHIFSCVACKAAKHLNIFVKCYGLSDCAGVAPILNFALTYALACIFDMNMPQEVKTQFFGKHVMIREFVEWMLGLYRNIDRNVKRYNGHQVIRLCHHLPGSCCSSVCFYYAWYSFAINDILDGSLNFCLKDRLQKAVPTG